MKQALLAASDLHRHFGGVRALDGFSCELLEEEVLGLIGPNGAGKTTLFDVLTGLVRVDKGSAYFKGRSLLRLPAHKVASLGIARTFQEVRLIRSLPVLANVLLWFPDQPGEQLSNVFLRPTLVRTRETELREKLSPKKRYDRFKNKAYFKELDRGIADQSPGPCAYSPPDKATLPSVRKSCETLFGKADRKLYFKKEDKESPSPTKYNVVYEFKGTSHVKGVSFGKAEKKFSLY